MSKLYETYENCESMIGKATADGKTPLLPIAHSTQNAQVEVNIDIFGNFQSAKAIDKEASVTIIPVTEDSGSRSSGVSPHPLFDKLQYIAGDYKEFVGENKDKYFNKYITQLGNWCASKYGDNRVKAIHEYLKKHRLIKDLVEKNVLQLDKNGMLSSVVKIQGISQSELFVRINVNTPGKAEAEVWKDKNIWNSFISYYISLQDTEDLCYGTGKVIPTTDKHPAKIRNTADMAKLISGNDSTGFTYRGRFFSKNQAASVGYETSQKAHNALKWLIDRQGYRNYDEAILAWGTRNENMPVVLEDTYVFFEDEMKSNPPTTYEGLAKGLSSAIAGYGFNLDASSETVVMGMEAATPGRLSVTYYRELMGSELLERVKNWHETCIWRHSYKFVEDGTDEKGKPKNKRITFVGAPSPKDIAYTAFGPKASEKLVKGTVHRLLTCIIDGKPLPFDLVKASVSRTLKPASLEIYEWEKVKSVTCALVKKYREERYEREEWAMELDNSKQEINYLLGRLLAVADEIERYALREMNEDRETNAIRLFERFSQNPVKTWRIINERLNPYRIKLGKKAEWLLQIRENISSMIGPEEFLKAKNLDGRFILGFDCQKKYIRDEIQKRKEAREASKNTGKHNSEEEN